MTMTGWIVASVGVGIVGKLVLWWWLSTRARGWVATPKGVMPGPSDAALRRARRFYSTMTAWSGTTRPLPMNDRLVLVPTDRVPPEFPLKDSSLWIPRPVPEGAVVWLIEHGAGAFKVRVDLVVPRPQDGVPPEAAPFQYVGMPVDPGSDWRVQFDHGMIWAMDRPVSQPENSNGPSEES